MPSMIWLALVFLTLHLLADPVPKENPVIIVHDGQILKDGRNWKGIGINYFSGFNRLIENEGDLTSIQGLSVLAEHKIPFIRFACCGFWPRDWNLYRTNSAEYFRRMDIFIAAARKQNIGLIPSLFWYDATIPDLVGEPRNQWGNPKSKTIAFMRQYVRDVVGRYLHEKSIWAWEMGNEFNLDIDLPNAFEHRPATYSELGTPKSRSDQDDLTHDMMVVATREFAKAVRAIDSNRPITTGNSLPRPSAEHLRTQRNWTPDSRQELESNLVNTTPAPCDLVSIHVYPTERDRFGAKNVSYEEILAVCMRGSNAGEKPLFIGEFGASDSKDAGGQRAARKEILEMLAAIKANGVPLEPVINFV